jgi:hypothetical protein
MRNTAFFFSIFVVFLIFPPDHVMAETASGPETAQIYLPTPLVSQLTADGKTLRHGVPLKAVVVDPDPAAPRRKIPAPAGLTTVPEAATASFSITYIPSGETDLWGESCYTFPENAKAAFNAAAGIWANTVSSGVPITIRACWADLASSTTLGYSGGGSLYRDFTGVPRASTWYAVSLANALHGSDLEPGAFDMHITYNQNFAWYYGTDGNTPTGQYDLMTVVLHEIAHGLNFSGSMRYAGGTGSWGYDTGYPNIYDVFMRDGSGTELVNTIAYPNPSTALGSALVSDNIWFHGSAALAANGSQRVKMYAPGTWSGGSSYSHLDYNTFNNTSNQLMVYAISDGESIHDPGAVTSGLLQDLGWTVSGSPPPVATDYIVTTSLTDPTCDTGFGGYVNLESFGIFPQAGLTGDTQWWSAFSGQNPIVFFGKTYSDGISFTDDGFAFLIGSPGSSPWTPQNLPDAAEPNTLIAPLWHDFEVVYNGTSGAYRGISLATATADITLIEFDDVQLFGTTESIGDFEIILNMGDGAKDIVFAYDNLNSALLGNTFTVGIENEAGDQAYAVINNSTATGVLANGLMICFDAVDTYSIGGMVSGLAAGNSVVLQNNMGDDLSVTGNGDFVFPTALVDGNPYAVTVLTQPADPAQYCAVMNGSGTVSGGDVNNVEVTCLDFVDLAMAVLPAGAGSTTPPVGTTGVLFSVPQDISATANGGYNFVNWSVSGSAVVDDPVAASTTVTLTGSATVTANFCSVQTWHPDLDEDGYGNPAGATINQCSQPAGYVADNTDCNDANASINPGATEMCDGVDNNCDGQIDEGVMLTWYRDSDQDGYGDPANSIGQCSQPAGYVADNTDCNDGDALEHPNQTWYKDEDGDGYSDGTTMVSCLRPENYYAASELTSTTGDPDDTDPDIIPSDFPWPMFMPAIQAQSWQ